MNRLIVNADDFGLHTLVNEGIIKGHQQGIITSTSLMASGLAFEEAVKMAQTFPKLGIGIHVTLVGSVPPVSESSEVPSLLDENGLFPESHTAFMKRVYTGKVNFNEVYSELDKQFSKIIDTGLTITHVDGHQHMHVLPQILEIVFALMKKYKLQKMRLPSEDISFLNGVYNPIRIVGKMGLSTVANKGRKRINDELITTPRYFWGMMNGGHLTEDRLLPILKEVAARAGAHEIMTHPGLDTSLLRRVFPWGYNWEEEMTAMCSSTVYEYIRANNIKLINYGEL